MGSKPTRSWRSLFDQIEREIGSRLEAGVERNEFQDFVALAVKARAQLDALGDDVATWALHQLHLPAHRDIKQLSEQITRMERRIRDLDARMARSNRGRAPASRRNGTP
jgi:hypothetical protein